MKRLHLLAALLLTLATMLLGFGTGAIASGHAAPATIDQWCAPGPVPAPPPVLKRCARQSSAQAALQCSADPLVLPAAEAVFPCSDVVPVSAPAAPFARLQVHETLFRPPRTI